MRAKGRNVKCPNHRGICTANLDRTDVIGNESRSAERCAHKIAQDETFASLLNIYGGDIRVIPTHLVVSNLSLPILLKEYLKFFNWLRYSN
jgi:hypothetical protein